MATHWWGKLIFDSNAARDEQARRIEDFIEAKVDVVPHAHADYTTDPSGVEYRNNLVSGTDSGPGVIWSIKMPGTTSDALVQEALTRSDQINAVATGGEHGNSQIPD